MNKFFAQIAEKREKLAPDTPWRTIGTLAPPTKKRERKTRLKIANRRVLYRRDS
jgi:hypothetical protein